MNGIRRLAAGTLAAVVAYCGVSVGWLPAADAAAVASTGGVSFSVDHGAWDTVFDVTGDAPSSGAEAPCVTNPDNQSTMFGLFVATPGTELQAPASDIFVSSYQFGSALQLNQVLSEAHGAGLSFQAEQNFADFGDPGQLQTATGSFSIGVMCFDGLGDPPIAAYWVSITFDGSGNWTTDSTPPTSTSTTSTSTSTTTTTSTSTTSTTTTTTTSPTTSQSTTASTTSSTTSSTAAPTPIAGLMVAGSLVLSANPTVHPGDQITVVGSGFLRTEPVDIVANSTPTALLTAQAVNGAFSVAVTVPASLSAGAHTLVLTGANSRASVSLPFVTVAAAGSSTTPSTSSTTSSSTISGSTPSTSAVIRVLAATGAPYSTVTVAGLGLLIFGAGALAFTRIRRSSRQRAH